MHTRFLPPPRAQPGAESGGSFKDCRWRKKRQLSANASFAIGVRAHCKTNLRNSGHVDDIASPRPERPALGEAGEPRPLDGDHRPLVVHPEAELPAGADEDLPRAVAKRRTHWNVANSAEGSLPAAGLIVERLNMNREGNVARTWENENIISIQHAKHLKTSTLVHL